MSEGPTVVVVTDDGDGAGAESGGSGTPAPPAYVTPGELDAKLELMRNEIGTQVSSALETAWAARDAAERAADDAAVATAVAVDAAAAADEAGDGDNDGAATAVEQDDTPNAPEKRSTPVKRAAGPAVQRSSGYGSPRLFGKR